MQMLSEDDLNLAELSAEELDAAWDLWFDLAQSTNDADAAFEHGVFAAAMEGGASAAALSRDPDARWPSPDARRAAEAALLASLKANKTELGELLRAASDHWGFEDPVYRFYHQSFKVFQLQAATTRIVKRLAELAPDRPLNPWFLTIVVQGTAHTFTLDDNRRWLDVARPVVEAFFHARYFLDMAVRYADLEAPPTPLPSGYAALLYLYGLR